MSSNTFFNGLGTIFDSIAKRLNAGTMTMCEAREELFRAGWFTYIPSEAEAETMLAQRSKFH